MLGLALALAFGAAASASAQSLQELYDLARAYDATYLAARALADTAQYRLGQAEALSRPNVGLGLGGNASRNDLPGASPTINTNTLTAGITGSYALYNRANSVTIEQARRGVEVSVADLQLAEQDLIVRVVQAYFDVLAAQDTLSTATAAKGAIAEQLASAKRNFEVGTATITDTREAQARYDISTAQEIAADSDLRVRRVQLDQLVGRVGVQPKPLAVPVVFPPLVSNDVNNWVSQGEQGHPQIRKAQLALDVARLETEKARAAGGVTVDLNGSVGAQNLHNNLNGAAAVSSGVGTTKTASLGFQINYPLYTGGLVQNRIKETLVLEEKSRNDLDFARRAVEAGTRAYFLSVLSTEAQVKAQEAAESSSKLALDATQLGYKVGVRVNLDVLNAQTQLYTTQRDLYRARYDVVLNRLRLLQASGQLSPEDIAKANRLLAP
ncbi:MAG: TolC family outer membrane protein [Burkholderiaceae bacterium]